MKTSQKKKALAICNTNKSPNPLSSSASSSSHHIFILIPTLLPAIPQLPLYQSHIITYMMWISLTYKIYSCLDMRWNFIINFFLYFVKKVVCWMFEKIMIYKKIPAVNHSHGCCVKIELFLRRNVIVEWVGCEYFFFMLPVDEFYAKQSRKNARLRYILGTECHYIFMEISVEFYIQNTWYLFLLISRNTAVESTKCFVHH